MRQKKQKQTGGEMKVLVQIILKILMLCNNSFQYNSSVVWIQVKNHSSFNYFVSNHLISTAHNIFTCDLTYETKSTTTKRFFNGSVFLWIKVLKHCKLWLKMANEDEEIDIMGDYNCILSNKSEREMWDDIFVFVIFYSNNPFLSISSTLGTEEILTLDYTVNPLWLTDNLENTEWNKWVNILCNSDFVSKIEL